MNRHDVLDIDVDFQIHMNQRGIKKFLHLNHIVWLMELDFVQHKLLVRVKKIDLCYNGNSIWIGQWPATSVVFKTGVGKTNESFLVNSEIDFCPLKRKKKESF